MVIETKKIFDIVGNLSYRILDGIKVIICCWCWLILDALYAVTVCCSSWSCCCINSIEIGYITELFAFESDIIGIILLLDWSNWLVLGLDWTGSGTYLDDRLLFWLITTCSLVVDDVSVWCDVIKYCEIDDGCIKYNLLLPGRWLGNDWPPVLCRCKSWPDHRSFLHNGRHVVWV